MKIQAILLVVYLQAFKLFWFYILELIKGRFFDWLM
jgi:hypothetical protein